MGFGAAGDGFVRIALIEDEPRIALAAERIQRFLEKAAREPRPAHTPAHA
jgi:alanine-synthesizing transaminase